MLRTFARAIAGIALTTALILTMQVLPVAVVDPQRILTIEPLPSPASGNSAEPQLTVDGDRTILSWVDLAGAHPALTFAERTAAGWSEPRIVTSGDELILNSSDVPSVRALADGTLAAQWLQSSGPNPEAYDLRLSWSRDQGRTWSSAVSPHHDGTKTLHGFASLFQAPGAGLGLVWLDGRMTNPEAPADRQGNMSLRAALYGPDGKQLREMVVDTRVCECCPTAAAATSDGIIVAYRDRSAAEIRDIYVSRLAGGRWSPPAPVHNDRWKIRACPVNGPAISARGRDVAVAWFSAKHDEGQAFAAFSRDGGRTFGPAIRIDDQAALGRVGIELLNEGSAVVTWVEFTSERSQLRARVVDPDGTRSRAVTIANMSGTRYPRVARFQNELLFAWTEADEGTSRVRTARASLAAP